MAKARAATMEVIVEVAAVAANLVDAAVAVAIRTDGGEVAMSTGGDRKITTGPAVAPRQCL